MLNALLVSEVDIGCRDDWWDRVHLLHADGGSGLDRSRTPYSIQIWIVCMYYMCAVL